MTLSTLSAMNGSILSGARIPFAVSRDGLAPKRDGATVRRLRTCRWSRSWCRAWSRRSTRYIGNFDELTDAVMFVSWLFYCERADRDPPAQADTADRVRAPGYPIVPALFVAVVGAA